jgi:hypothetical protein
MTDQPRRIHPERRPTVLNQHTCPICYGLPHCRHADRSTIEGRAAAGLIIPRDPAELINERRARIELAYQRRWRTRAIIALYAAAVFIICGGLTLLAQ